MAARSRRWFLRLAGGAAVALGFVRATPLGRAAEPGHENLVDGASGFERGTCSRCRVVDGRIIASGPARFVSREIEATRPFAYAGIHWDAAGPAETLAFAFRARDATGRWGAWTPLRVEARDGERPVAGTFAALAFAGEGARSLQYRVDFPGTPVVLRRVAASVFVTPPAAGRAAPAERGWRAQGPGWPRSVNLLPRGVTPGLVRDTAEPVGDATHAVDIARGALLEVVPRAAWGADEALRFDAAGRELWREMFIPIRALVVHHTATRNTYASAEEAAAEIRSIQYYHSEVQGWHDIGYNAIVDRFGNIYEGRHGRGGDPGDSEPREVLSAGVSAGHVHEHNDGSAGVALLGDSDLFDWPMRAAEGPMWDALVRYCAFEAARAGVRVLDSTGGPATVDFLRKDRTWHPGMSRLGGHRESEQTFCPGEGVLPLLPALRSAVAAALAEMPQVDLALTRVAPAEREAVPGTRVTYRWAASSPVSRFQYAVEGWFRPDGEDDIIYLEGHTSASQPRLRWIDAPASQREASFVPAAPGQYTFHVRAMVMVDNTVVPALFEATDTVLVRDEPPPEP